MIDQNSDQPNPGDESKFNSNDLDWLAFCYVADEVESAERTRFETRLETDERAQQAVVNAVQHAQVLYTSLNSTSFNDGEEPVALAARGAESKRNSFRRSRTLFAAAAAMLILAAGWTWFANSDTTGVDQLAALESEQLAVAWVDSLVVMDDEELEGFIEEDELSIDLEDDESDNWMLLALTDLEHAEGVERETTN